MESKKNDSLVAATPVIRAKGFNSRNLIKAIFDDQNPELVVRTIPAQSLYVAIRSQGLESSAELLEIATLEQCRLLLDFDCWSRDSFREDHFWEWLAITDATDSLALLQKILKVCDLKLIALMIARYVEVISFEQPEDAPPGPNFYTPDRGRTWLSLKTEDQNEIFLMNRLLALLFESNSDLFYQILSIPGIATPSELEEESYQEKQKRLSSEGIPDMEFAAELNAPLPTELLLSEVSKTTSQATIEDISAVEPVIYEGSFEEPLRSLVNQLLYDEAFESELTLLLNASIVHYGIDISEITQVLQIADKVKGALNLGLEHALSVNERSAIDLYKALGLRGIYRHGLSLLNDLRKEARTVERLGHEHLSAETLVVVQGLMQRFPAVPDWVKNSAERDPEKVDPRFSAIQFVKEVTQLKDILRAAGSLQ